MAEKINAQKGLYTVFLNGLREGKPHSEYRVIRCLDRCVDPYASFKEYLSTAENRALRFVVSNTTEAGIAFNGQDKITDAPPASFPGKLAVWLHRRYSFFQGDASAGLVFLPCELIDRNGAALRQVVLQYADAWRLGPGFRAWVEERIAFCNTLVDRIVAGYPGDRAPQLTAELGYHDELMAS